MAHDTCTPGQACAPHERCSGGFATCICHAPRSRAVLLLNLGTPDGPDTASVRRYLIEFLGDPEVIKLPRAMGWFGPILARIIAFFRGPRSAEAYAKIWWDEGEDGRSGSPLAVITERQAAGVETRLPGGWRVYHAMRYGNPSMRDVLKRIAEDRVTDLVVVPMYPQWAGPTTGTALERLYDEIRTQGLRLNLSVRAEWYDDSGYIEAQARLVERFARERGLGPESATLLFSTHSMPKSYIADGDPYEGHVRRSCELVRERLGWPAERTRIGFQSKLGPVPWLEPATEAVLGELAGAGEKNVIVVPISFTADCLETIEEIGMEYAEEFAEASGGGTLHRVPAPNDDPRFLDALVGLVRRGAHRIAPGAGADPLFGPPNERADLADLVDRLAAVGVATQRLLETPAELDRPLVDEALFQRIKRPALEVGDVLGRILARDDVEEAWFHNTCQRYELFVLAREGVALHRLGVALAAEVAGEHAGRAAVRTGRDAWWHLLRTSNGMNSRLPGDTDVLAQLRGGQRMAEGAGHAGPGSRRIVEAVAERVQDVRACTDWGRYAVDYCRAALAPLVGDLRLDEARIVAVGGSSTTLSILEHLRQDHDVDDQKLTVVYRGSGRRRLAKVLRKLVKRGERLDVERYDQDDVVEAIGGADVLFLGIDRKQPILRREHLEGLRDFGARPLTVIDFNAHGSTDGLDGLDGVRVVSAADLGDAVDLHARSVLEDPGFDAVRRSAEGVLRALARDPHAAVEDIPLHPGQPLPAAAAEGTSGAAQQPPAGSVS